jgi:FemAB family protein
VTESKPTLFDYIRVEDMTNYWGERKLTVVVKDTCVDDPMTEQFLEKIGYVRNEYSSVWARDLEGAEHNYDSVWYSRSIYFMNNGVAVALWPIGFKVVGTEIEFGTKIRPVVSPLFMEGLPLKTQKRILKACHGFVQEIIRTHDIETWYSATFIDNSAFERWHLLLMGYGAKITVRHDVYIDLSTSKDEIRRLFRKRTKTYVSESLKLWDVQIMDSSNEVVWNEFKQLHIVSAGRQVRSDRFWEVHHDEIARGNAFLVYALNEEKKLVGACYFSLTRSEGLSNSAAYDRTLFKKPISHGIQMVAIEEMQRRKIAWFRFGERPFSGQEPVPSDKEIQIGDFKQGFGTHLKPRFILRSERDSKNGDSNSSEEYD